MKTRYLTLREAVKTDRLADFIAQEEARGVGPAERADLERVIRAAVRPPQSEDQTSRSASSGDSPGT